MERIFNRFSAPAVRTSSRRFRKNPLPVGSGFLRGTESAYRLLS